MDDAKIFEGVCECLRRTLDDDAIEIKMDDKLIYDVGLDSLDLIHLIFTMEQRFGITISPRDIERRAKEKLGSTPFEIDGVYTPEGLAELRTAMPEIPIEELKEGISSAELPRHFRVATMMRLVKRFMEDSNG